MEDPATADGDPERLTMESESLPDLFADLVDNAKEVARAEVGVLRAKAFRRLVKARAAFLLSIASMLLVQAAVITALIGLVALLAFYVGTAWATVIVTIVALVVAGVLGRLALNHIEKIVNPDEGAS